MDADDVLRKLTASAFPLEELEAPPAPGVYAYFLAAGRTICHVKNLGDAPLYVGVSTNLARREFETHFAAGKTGFSTLRRSLGAILTEELGLRAQPRGRGASKRDGTHYRFDDAGEERLSVWMRTHLRTAVQPAPRPDDLERELIVLARPPLNLKGWPNPAATKIRAQRRACAEQARGLPHA